MPKQPSSMRRRGQKREVVFDPEARKAYLRGFSERKKQRRAFGLAMQKVKDRQAKIEERAEARKEDMERIEEAEQQKSTYLSEAMAYNAAKNPELHKEEDDDESSVEGELQDDEQESAKEKNAALNTKTYDDKETESHWGGHVTVTTSVVELEDDDSSDDEERPKKRAKAVDVEQKRAGKVETFLAGMKGKMPGKKKDHTVKRKGRNGAADMKGMGGSGAFKVAQKVLSKAKQLQGSQKKSGKKRR
eukprot:Nitzschia sp. Nitz4//scaffold51_size120721//16267//17004//NITZ4_003717-RA/size120721-processed-gene-0.112-mRNA-1//1//CDS//3329553832//5043//frame0